MNYEKCGLTEYLMQHDKLQHAIIIVIGVVFVLKSLDMLLNNFDFKSFLRLFMSKILILIICFFVKIIDYLTISNEMLYDIIVTFYIFESMCELFLMSAAYGLPLPEKLQSLINKYVVNEEGANEN